MRELIVTVFVSIFVIATPMIDYLSLRMKKQKIEENAKERGAPLSNDDLDAVKKYSELMEKRLKLTALMCLLAFIWLLQSTVNL